MSTFSNMIKLAREKKQKAKESLLKTTLRNRFDEQIKLYEDKIKIKSSDIQSRMKNITTLQRDVANFIDYINILRSQKNNLDKKITSIYNSLKQLEKSDMYSKIEVRDNGIVGVTKNIKIKYNRHEYNLGKYKVTVLFEGKVHICSANPSNHTNCHPHVNSDGTACWGNAAEDIAKGIGQSDFLSVFKICYNFLNSYDNTHPYEKIENWGK